MNPLVSILIPAYNASATIRDTLLSAVRQTWPSKEVIVVNDGSTDDTEAVLREFSGHGVRVVTQPNAGAAAARNAAYRLSRGEYIQWLDADDLLASDKIELQMRARGGCSERTVLSGAWGLFWHRPSRARFTPTCLWCDLEPVEWLLRKMEQNVFMQTACWLVPTALLDAAGPWDTMLLGDDDGEYFCRVLLSSDFVRFVPGARTFYRMAGGQRLSYVGQSPAKMEALWRSMRLHVDYLRKRDDTDRVRHACLQYLQNQLMFFYPERPDLVAEARELAMELGGELSVPPRFPWKYSWLAATCGPGVGKRALVLLPQVRCSFLDRWDRMMRRVERRG